MPDYIAAVGRGELIGFDAVFDRVAEVDDIRQTACVALIRADRDMTVVKHYITGHPVLGVRGRGRKLLCVFTEKDE